VGHVFYGIAVLLQVGPEHLVRDGLFAAVVEGEHGPHVGVDHEAAQSPQQEVEVVRRAVLAALRVGNADDAVYVLIGVGDAVHLPLQRPHEPGEPGRGAQHDDVVARPDAAARAAPVAHEGAGLVVRRNLRAGPEGFLFQDVGLEFGVAEVGFPGQIQAVLAIPAWKPAPALVVGPFGVFFPVEPEEGPVALAQHAQDLLVARVVARLDVV
jgi:hypothetical protein